MRFSTLMVSLVVVVGWLGVARADVAPPDVCTSPGQPCQNGGPQFNQAGICVGMTCTKMVPAADGGQMSISYVCNRCQPTGAGGNGGGAGTTATGGAAGGGGTAGSGGMAGSGGVGGSTATGGTTGTGGTTATGGATGSGGTTATGGATGSGGTSAPVGTGGSAHGGGGSSGCAVAPGSSSDDVPGVLLVLVAIGLTVVVRRRHASL